MISDQQFIDYIQQIGESYEKIKDAVYSSDLSANGKVAQEIIGAASDLRDISCIALRESHVQSNFKNN